MNAIGMIASVGATGLEGITSHLPWGWFAVMGAADAGLAALVMARRLRARAASPGAPALAEDTLVRLSGWWVPRARASDLPERALTYAWPLHREYMVRRLV